VLHLCPTCIPAQVEADIRPFRSLLLGLFFTTTGSSMDLQLLYQQWPIVIALLGGLLAVKIGIIGTISQWFGLSK
jgi:Kef-type K+ transport system membrane component KefB